VSACQPDILRGTQRSKTSTLSSTVIVAANYLTRFCTPGLVRPLVIPHRSSHGASPCEQTTGCLEMTRKNGD